MGWQFFDGLGKGGKMTETNENVDQNNFDDEDYAPLTFDEILQDPDYQRAYDKKVAAALEKSHAKWQQDLEAQKTEAEKLGRMNADEKLQYELDKVSKERDAATGELNAYKLKNEALKIATEKGMDASLLELFDYGSENAESIKKKLDNVDSVLKKEIERQINDRLKQSAPKDVKSVERSDDAFARRVMGLPSK